MTYNEIRITLERNVMPQVSFFKARSVKKNGTPIPNGEVFHYPLKS